MPKLQRSEEQLNKTTVSLRDYNSKKSSKKTTADRTNLKDGKNLLAINLF